MERFRKHQLAIAVAAGLALAAGPAPGQHRPQSQQLDALFAELSEPGRDDWERIEGEITRIWSRSGSASMDLLLRRGNEALEAEEYDAALEHFTALTDHAPDFAEGWNGRATTFYLMGEFSLALADVERVLALNPRHFGALAGLAFMLEQMGETEMALQALRAVRALNPNRPNITEAISRLERTTGAVEL